MYSPCVCDEEEDSDVCTSALLISLQGVMEGKGGRNADGGGQASYCMHTQMYSVQPSNVTKESQ